MHIIRLHGAWDYVPLADNAAAGEPPPPGRTDVPADWDELLGRGFQGRVRCTRRFHRPTGLEGRARVWLVLEAANVLGEVLLNERPLDAALQDDERLRIEVTDRLRHTTEVSLTIELPGGAIHSARLEIEE
ncbi:MAG: hypothetical protein KY475_05025 [Planctomycetes bacterium]|nr:hypothetical protein [Planctomycetota bacterium]